MAGFDRSKYRAAPMATVQNQVSVGKQNNTYYGDSGDYAPFYKNVDGTVIKRVLPAHEPGDSPYVPMLTTMLECEVDEKKDGVVIGKKIAKKKVFLATLHAGAKNDIVDEYIKRVYELAEQYQDKTERDRFLNPITGYRMGKQWVSGIRPNLEYVFYAYIEGQIYRDSLKPKQMEALNRESAELCAQNDTVAVDMFSDPNSGFPIQWSRAKDDNNKTVETIKSLPLPMRMTWDEYFDKYAVPDSVLEKLETYPSLKELYVDSYKERDFELALNGLKRFDEANGYNIFAQEDFLDVIEAVQAFLKEKWAGQPQTEKKPSVPKTAPAEEAPAPKRAARRPAAAKVAEPTTDEKLAVINAEFVRQYGEGYEALTEADYDSAADLDDVYQLALKKEDLGYGLERVDTAPKPAPAPAPKPAAPKADPAPAPAVNPAADPQPESGMSALARIQALKAKREAEKAAQA